MTIKDLAEKTGYSVGTVSRALNGMPDVSKKARAVILRAAAESGYEPNLNAKQLKQQHSALILAIVRGARNELFGMMLVVIQSLIAQSPYRLETDYIDEEEDEVHRAVQLCREKKPLGILFLGGSSRNFQEGFENIRIPAVLLTNDARELGFSNLSSVSTDDALASQTAVERLLDLGHRDIVIIGGPRENSDTGRQRYEGCVSAFAGRGIPFHPEQQYRESRYSYREGYQAALALLDRNQSFTAVFAMADVLAVGAVRALRDRGLKVPRDVSVIGIDGLPLGDFLCPRLSTVRQEVEEMARRGVTILLDVLENHGPARHETVPFTLLPGESLAAAKP